MSYDKCKRIILDEKKNKIKMTIASNNLYPITYHTYDNCYEQYENFDDKLLVMFWDLQGCMLQISTINENTENFEYALKKVSEYCKENNINTYDYWDLQGELATMKRFRLAGLYYNKYNKENYKVYDEWTKTQDRDYVKKLENKAFVQALREIYGKLFEIFKKALYEQIKGEYILIYANCYNVCKLGKYDRYYSKFSYGGYTPVKMSYKKAYIFTKDMDKYNLKIQKVEEV